MTKCKCGCGKDVTEGSEFLQGHYSKWKKNQKIPLILHDPDPTFKPDPNKTEPEKLKEFLNDLPVWSANTDGGILRRTIRHIVNPNRPLIDMVFVGENREPRICKLPYDPEKNRVIIPGKGYFVTPIKSGIGFYHEDYMLPLVNAPNLKDRFQLPAHVVESAYSSGLAEGMFLGFKELIEDNRKWRYVAYAGIILAILCAAAAAIIALNSHETIKVITGQMANMTTNLQGPGITINKP